MVFAFCNSSSCATYGTTLHGLDRATVACPTCNGRLQWIGLDVASGGSASNTQPPKGDKKRPNDDHESEQDFLTRDKKMKVVIRGGKERQGLESSIFAPGHSNQRTHNVESDAKPSEPCSGVGTELVEFPSGPDYSQLGFCIFHHGSGHETRACMAGNRSQPPAVFDCYVKVLCESHMTSENIDGLIKPDQMPRTIFEAMAHISKLNNICKRASAFVKDRDDLLIGTRHTLAVTVSQTVLEQWDCVVNVLGTHTQYVLGRIMGFVALLQQELMYEPIRKIIPYKEVWMKEPYTHEMIEEFIKRHANDDLPTPPALIFESVRQQMIELVHEHDAIATDMAVHLDGLVWRFRKHFRQSKVFDKFFYFLGDLNLQTPDDPSEYPGLGLTLCQFPDVVGIEDNLAIEYQQFLDSRYQQK